MLFSFLAYSSSSTTMPNGQSQHCISSCQDGMHSYSKTLQSNNMRKRGSIVYSLMFVALAVSTIGCKSKSDDPQLPELSEQEKVVAILTSGTATWTPPTASGVTLAGIDVTEEFFSGFTIRFTGNQLFTTGSTPVWLRQDTWQFKPGTSNIIIRGQDNKEVTITSISETQLILTLDWTETTFGGRTNSLPGRYSFTLNK